MTDLQRQTQAFIESECRRIGCANAIGPLQEGYAAMCESITAPTVWLRKAFRGVRTTDCPDTPKFNQVWHRYEPYEGSSVALEVALENPYLIRHMVENWESEGEFPEICEKYRDDDDFYCMDENDVKELMELDPEMFARVIRNSDEFEQNDYRVLDFNHTVVNGWLVHNSDNAWDIWREGFQYGNDMGHLAYTNAGSTSGKDLGDYLFAFPIDEAPSPTYRGLHNGLKYGEASIVFIGTGNEFFHCGDNEKQVIFDRREPKGCFLVAEQEIPDKDGYSTYWCVIGNNKYHPLYHSEEYEDCLNWISNNGNRYINSMSMWNKNTPGRQVAYEWKMR